MSTPTQSRIAEARADLENTLNAIEDKLNLPKRITSSYRANPVPWIIGAAVAAVAVAGVIAWAILSDDD
jgi:hypothetical protein